MTDRPDKEEQTEDATPRRLEEARDKGQVAFSSELMAGATLLAAALAVVLAGSHLADSTGALLAHAPALAQDMGTETLTLPDFEALLAESTYSVLPAFLALVLPVLLVATLVGYAQVGVRVTPKSIAPKLSKLDPIQGVKRIFGLKAVVRTLLSAAKIALILAAVLFTVWGDLIRMGRLAGADLGPVLAAVVRVIVKSMAAAVLVVLAIGVFDLWYQRFQFKKDMRMSKKEIKDEHKTTEGDPLVRSRIRQIQREVASRRMMADVPDATVVVTNPTHFAVALKYDPDRGDAPRVVAKGVDEVAQAIRRVAAEAHVTVYEDPPLARALYRDVELDDGDSRRSSTRRSPKCWPIVVPREAGLRM